MGFVGDPKLNFRCVEFCGRSSSLFLLDRSQDGAVASSRILKSLSVHWLTHNEILDMVHRRSLGSFVTNLPLHILEFHQRIILGRSMGE